MFYARLVRDIMSPALVSVVSLCAGPAASGGGCLRAENLRPSGWQRTTKRLDAAFTDYSTVQVVATYRARRVSTSETL